MVRGRSALRFTSRLDSTPGAIGASAKAGARRRAHVRAPGAFLRGGPGSTARGPPSVRGDRARLYHRRLDEQRAGKGGRDRRPRSGAAVLGRDPPLPRAVQPVVSRPGGGDWRVLCFRAPLDRALNPDLFRLADPAARVEPFAAVDGFARARPDLIVTGFPLHPPPGGARRGCGARRNVPAAGLRPGFPRSWRSTDRGAPDRAGWDRRHLVQGIYLFHYTLLAGIGGRWLMGGGGASPG